MSSPIGVSTDELDTPALIIDMDQLEFNIKAMADYAQLRNIKLRPHIKTHKAPDIARIQINQGASGIACAKIDEAQIMAVNGINDIHIVYPVVSRRKIERIVKLLNSANVIGLIDNFEQAQHLSKVLRKYREVLSVTVAIDVGLHREGILPEAAIRFFQRLSTLPHIDVVGISTHAGHAYAARSRDEVIRIGKEEGELMVQVAKELRKAHFTIDVVSVGSTPTAQIAGEVAGITEIRPGNYVFYDATQVGLGVVPFERCALKILTTVVSKHSNPYRRYIVDAGSKVLTLDKGAHGTGFLQSYGVVVGYENSLFIERLSEEHGIVRIADKTDLGIGDQIKVIPNHACSVINQFDIAYGIRGEKVVNIIKIEARGKYH